MVKAITSLALLLIFPAVYGVNIYVGDDEGWTDYTDYGDWVKKKTFTTNDLLVFQYSGRHSVAEVTETEFNYCDSSNPIYYNETSPTSFPLTTVGKRFFICTTFGHCAEGMKLVITVTDGSTTGTPPPPPSRTTTSPPSRSTTRSTPASETTPSPPVSSGATVILADWNSLFVGVLIVVATLFGVFIG